MDYICETLFFTRMANNKDFHFVGKTELARRYCLCLNTFNVWIKKIENQIPMYVKKQRRFSPSQVKFFDNVFVHNPDQIQMNFEA